MSQADVVQAPRQAVSAQQLYVQRSAAVSYHSPQVYYPLAGLQQTLQRLFGHLLADHRLHDFKHCLLYEFEGLLQRRLALQPSVQLDVVDLTIY